MEPSVEAAVGCNDLARALSGTEVKIFEYGTDYDRFIRERVFASELESDIPLVLTGSIYLLGELRRRLVKSTPKLW